MNTLCATGAIGATEIAQSQVQLAQKINSNFHRVNSLVL